LFYMRDVRGGQGERDSFRMLFEQFSLSDPQTASRLISLVPEYGRWDDILGLINSPSSLIRETVLNIVRNQLREDPEAESPSLLAKWMPSVNTSSQETRELARNWVRALGATERQYRKLLSHLRNRIRVVETQMSAGHFNEINYAHVPSRAMMQYRTAFYT